MFNPRYSQSSHFADAFSYYVGSTTTSPINYHPDTSWIVVTDNDEYVMTVSDSFVHNIVKNNDCEFVDEKQKRGSTLVN